METTNLAPVAVPEIQKVKKPWLSLILLFVIGLIFSYLGIVIGLIWIFWKGKSYKLWRTGALVAGFLLAILISSTMGSYFQKVATGFIESKSPELKVVYAALQQNYPDEKNINVSVNTFYGANNMESKSVTISVVSSSPISALAISEIAQTVCNALTNASLTVDSVGVNAVVQKTYFWFFTTSFSSGQNATCNQWLNVAPQTSTSNDDIQQAKLLWSEGKYPDMIPVATHALNVATTDEEKAYAYYWRGVGYYKQRMNTAALADENAAIALDSTFPGPYITRSGVYADEGNYQAEFADAQKAVQLDPTYAWAYNALGNAYLDLGDKANAIKALQEAVQLDPNTSLFRLNLTRAQGR